METIQFTAIPGIKVGHAQDRKAATGCTVVLCEAGAVAGVDVRGGAPGTRETDLLNPLNLVDRVHAVLLTGGSAFGLDAAGGIMRYLEERGIGFDVQVTRVPIVAGAVLFDLACGDFRVRPDAAMGYQACLQASADDCPQGSVGAGTGATVGKIRGMNFAMKGGVGSVAYRAGELMVGALVAVNCLGDVVDPASGRIVAGALADDRRSFIGTEQVMIGQYERKPNPFCGNTTIGVVATNAILNKAQAAKVAGMAHNGYGRTIRPAHTLYDGDTVFAIGTGMLEADISVVGLLAAQAMEQAVLRAVRAADSLAGIPGRSALELP
ncbi:L-aminopeptidase/D-esterase-like protein [Hydrogenispora ethanolica]|jgi:L-aminopeptidase/D-esterase-like protein|uniref:L-aminopeptidase/D-esterase-like protein n=1 Tax=Hydrogenispora ethanolica TaxID=1082276 RepID=A0A4R1RAL6_HYDET|nr:P1 family peptidase [Hydrogenispora ethanolica]TCL62758.1 L-aminopeptidase/D-esterase-like protein [Hydrogenispora ethanolica]